MNRMSEFYKPIKKPVTLRLDADVLAWFKAGTRLPDSHQSGSQALDGNNPINFPIVSRYGKNDPV